MFHTLNMIVCGSMFISSRRELSDTQSLSCSSKLLVTVHAQNECSTDSLFVLQRENKGLLTILKLNSILFKCKILFKILRSNERWDGSNVACLGAYKLSSSRYQSVLK